MIFEETLLNIECVLILSTTLRAIFLILRRINRNAIINVQKSLCKLPLVPSKADENGILSTD